MNLFVASQTEVMCKQNYNTPLLAASAHGNQTKCYVADTQTAMINGGNTVIYLRQKKYAGNVTPYFFS